MSNVIADGSIANFNIGELFIDGQQRDVWCNSKKPITDLKMYYAGVGQYRSSDPVTKSNHASMFIMMARTQY